MARTKAPTGARRPAGSLPRAVSARMAAHMASTQECGLGPELPSETEEESIFPEDEVRAPRTPDAHMTRASVRPTTSTSRRPQMPPSSSPQPTPEVEQVTMLSAIG